MTATFSIPCITVYIIISIVLTLFFNAAVKPLTTLCNTGNVTGHGFGLAAVGRRGTYEH